MLIEGNREKKDDDENGNDNGINSEKIKNKVGSIYGSQVEIKKDEAKLFLENSNWLKTKEAAEYLRTSPKQIRKWVYQGRMKAYKLLGKSLRFKKTELDLLIEGGRKWE